MPTKKEIERIQNTGVRGVSAPRVKTRKDYNKEILHILEDLIEALPEQRFGQIICNYVLPDYRERDPFFEESKTTLERLQSLGR